MDLIHKYNNMDDKVDAIIMISFAEYKAGTWLYCSKEDSSYYINKIKKNDFTFPKHRNIEYVCDVACLYAERCIAVTNVDRIKKCYLNSYTKENGYNLEKWNEYMHGIGGLFFR